MLSSLRLSHNRYSAQKQCTDTVMLQPSSRPSQIQKTIQFKKQVQEAQEVDSTADPSLTDLKSLCKARNANHHTSSASAPAHVPTGSPLVVIMDENTNAGPGIPYRPRRPVEHRRKRRTSLRMPKFWVSTSFPAFPDDTQSF